MSTPFSQNIVGSWLFVRSSLPETKQQIIYHFTADGGSHWEMEYLPGKRRLFKNAVQYKIEGALLTFIYTAGSTRDLKLTQEEDGSVEFLHERDAIKWWAVRLSELESYSLAFVSDTGALIEPLA